jgi:hypothetical protein
MHTCDWDSEVLRDISRWFVLLANTHCPDAAVSWVDGVQTNAAISVDKNALKTAVQKSTTANNARQHRHTVQPYVLLQILDIMLIFCRVILLQDLTVRKRH